MDTPTAQGYSGNMGVFGRSKTASTARILKTGSAVNVVDVDPGFLEWVRTRPAKGKSHTATVRLDLEGGDILVRAGDGSVVGRMTPDRVKHYLGEFEQLRKRGEYGVAEIEVSRADLKPRCQLLINADAACRDGGIL